MVFSHYLPKPPSVSDRTSVKQLKIKVHSNNHPLAGALIFLVIRDTASSTLHQHQCIANDQGIGLLNYYPSTEVPVYVSALSLAGTWYGASQKFESPIELNCPALKFNEPIQWWHKAVGIQNYEPTMGSGINIGLIDTGCGPHPYLKHVYDLGAIIGGTHTSNGSDVSYHGTFMAGLIAARPTDASHPSGLAPGANLSSLRVYGSATEGANADDVADAINYMAISAKTDLINLSLSSDKESQSQTAAIKAARSAGTLCIAAAGNCPVSPVGYPAATHGVIAVAAMGYNASGPLPSTNSVFEPPNADMKGENGTYLCNVSSYGQQLSCLAPGAAIASTVPSPKNATLYASLIGSSNATAIVTAVLASALSRDPEYLSLPRNERRAEYAEITFNKMCRTIALSQQFEGQGLPVLVH
jgi:hypothetical protein